MVFRTARYLAKEGWHQLGLPNTTSTVVQVVLMQAPIPVLVSIGNVGGVARSTIKHFPLLGDVEMTRIPLVGPILIDIQAGYEAAVLEHGVESKTAPLMHAEAVAEALAAVTTAAQSISDSARTIKAVDAAIFELIPESMDSEESPRLKQVAAKNKAGSSVSKEDQTGRGPGAGGGTKASLVNKEAAAHAINGISLGASFNARRAAPSKALGAEDLVGSISATIISSARDEVKDRGTLQ